MARSPHGLELVGLDGSRYSGVFLIIDNRALYQLAAQHAQVGRMSRTADLSEVDRRRHPGLFDEFSDPDEHGPCFR